MAHTQVSTPVYDRTGVISGSSEPSYKHEGASKPQASTVVSPRASKFLKKKIKMANHYRIENQKKNKCTMSPKQR